MKINLEDLKKIEATSIPAELPDLVEAIIRVKQPDYVPDEVRLRAHISPRIFTCEFNSSLLPTLEKDPRVESISISKKLHST